MIGTAPVLRLVQLSTQLLMHVVSQIGFQPLTASIFELVCRTRQASITTELIEIISGATALADK